MISNIVLYLNKKTNV